MISRILVPTDGSKTAQKAVRFAVDLAKRLHASIIALSVIDERSALSETVPAGATPMHIAKSIEDYLREAGEEYGRQIKKLCEKNGVRSKTVITKGHPVEDIVKAAEGGDAEWEAEGWMDEVDHERTGIVTKKTRPRG